LVTKKILSGEVVEVKGTERENLDLTGSPAMRNLPSQAVRMPPREPSAGTCRKEAKFEGRNDRLFNESISASLDSWIQAIWGLLDVSVSRTASYFSDWPRPRTFQERTQ
jgi:hypothetical protein